MEFKKKSSENNKKKPLQDNQTQNAAHIGFSWWIVIDNICFLLFSLSYLDIHTNYLKFRVVLLVTHI